MMMGKFNNKYNIQVEVITPLHIGAGSEKDWIKGSDFVVDKNRVQLLNLSEVVKYIGIFDLSNALINKDEEYLKSKLANNMAQCVEQEFNVNYVGNNDIKTHIKNSVSNKPIMPGSSLKGAIRSILLNYLKQETLGNKNRLDENAILGDSLKGDSLLRFIKISDTVFEKTNLVNTKIFNLPNTNSGGWKHASRQTNAKFMQEGFNTFYEIIEVGEKSLLSISLADKAFSNYDKLVKPFSKEKSDLINNDISFLFSIINEYTRKYLKKEKSFFEKYIAEKSDVIVKSIESLLESIPNNGKSCVLKLGAGSGFHSITGDWQFDDYSIDRVDSRGRYSNSQRGVKLVDNHYKDSAKSRKIAINNEDNLSLMGFVKLTIVDDEALAIMEKEKEKLRQEKLLKLQKQETLRIKLEQEKELFEQNKLTYQSLITQAEDIYLKGDNNTALKKIEEAEALNIEIEMHEKLKQDILNSIELVDRQNLIELENEKETEKKKKEMEVKLDAGLTAYIDEKNLNKEYVVRDIKMLRAKTDKYFKDANISQIDKSEWEVLEISVLRIYENSNQRNKKDWQKFEGKTIWQNIASWTSEEFAKQLFEKLINA